MSNTDTTPDTVKDSQGGESTAKPAGNPAGKQAPKSAAAAKLAPAKQTVIPAADDSLPDLQPGQLGLTPCGCFGPADASRVDRAIELYKTLIMAHPMQATHLQPSWIRASFLVVDEMQKFDVANPVGSLKVNSPL